MGARKKKRDSASFGWSTTGNSKCQKTNLRRLRRLWRRFDCLREGGRGCNKLRREEEGERRGEEGDRGGEGGD